MMPDPGFIWVIAGLLLGTVVIGIVIAGMALWLTTRALPHDRADTVAGPDGNIDGDLLSPMTKDAD